MQRLRLNSFAWSTCDLTSMQYIFISSDDATRKLEDQELQQRVNHDELLTDLSYIREKAKEVWEKIGISNLFNLLRSV